MPRRQWHRTPLFLFGTAGLRKLPAEGRAALLDDVRAALSRCNFRCVHLLATDGHHSSETKGICESGHSMRHQVVTICAKLEISAYPGTAWVTRWSPSARSQTKDSEYQGAACVTRWFLSAWTPRHLHSRVDDHLASLPVLMCKTSNPFVLLQQI